jgi:ABC-type Fe3+-hydroxamate transport system substrate-binding protein
LVVLAVAGCSSGERASESAAAPDDPGQRIVSLNPSLTEILLMLGARAELVGVDSFSHRSLPAVADLPDVGGLFNPSLETIVGLAPDLVVLVPSVEQRDLRSRLEGLGLRVVAFPNIRFDDVLENVEDLGALVGREQAARRRIDAIRGARTAVRLAVGEREPVPCIVVLQRDPLFVVGSGSFLDEMLADVGGHNLAGVLGDPYPRVGLEWLVAAAPQVIVDMSLDAGVDSSVLDYWRRWPTIPAVASERVLHVEPELVSMPGPQLDRALRVLARALHGEAIESEIDRYLGDAEAGGKRG